jgi:hypothetical protein
MSRLDNYLTEKVNKTEINDILKSTDVKVGAEFEFLVDEDRIERYNFDEDLYNEDMDEWNRFENEYEEYKRDYEEWDNAVLEHERWEEEVVDTPDEREEVEPVVPKEPAQPERPGYSYFRTSLEEISEPDANDERYQLINNDDFYSVKNAVENYIHEHQEMRFCLNWSFQEDSSLGSNGIEIASKPGTLKEFMDTTPKMFTMIDSIGDTDDTCGFHIGISMDNMDKVDTVKLALFTDEQYIWKSFTEREVNRYVEHIKNTTGNELLKIVKNNDVNDDKKLLEKMIDKRKVTDAYESSNHYDAINIEHLDSSNPYIEFRYLGGTGYHKRWQEIKKMLAIFIYNLKLARDPEFKKKEYYLKINRILRKLQTFVLMDELEKIDFNISSKGIGSEYILRATKRKKEIEQTLKFLPKLNADDLDNMKSFQKRYGIG